MLVIRDRSELLSREDTAALLQESWPFDVHILIENVGNLGELQQDAHSWFDSPNVVVVALDPVAHKVVVRFGSSTRVHVSDYDNISAAGNLSFRQGHWRDGLDAILASARVSAMTSQTAVVVQTPVGTTSQSTNVVPILAICLVAAGFIGLTIWIVRRIRQDRAKFTRALEENRLETSELVSRNVKNMTEPEPSTPYRKPAKRPATPVTTANARPVVAVANSTPFYSNVYVSTQTDRFAEGLLVGQALSAPREVVRERVVEREQSRDYDSGGSSSSYDSDSGSSSSFDTGSIFDSGGGSSDFGGGGGFDGGGGDSGW